MKDTTKEVIISSIKSLFSAIPYGIGGILNETVFDGRSRLEQGRINSFCTLFKNFLEKNAEKIDAKKMTTEEFSDLFIGVLDKIRKTKSEDKITRYNDIVVNYLLNHGTDLDHYLLFLNLIENTSETEIKVLVGISDHIDRFYIDNAQNKGDWEKTKTYLEAAHYEISEETFMFCKQSLASKGLLVDKGGSSFDYTPYYMMNITEFGKRFLEFIQNKGEHIH